MKKLTELPEDLAQHVELAADRENLTLGEMIAPVPTHGRSVAWQEQWKQGVMAGLLDAEEGNFSSNEEIESVLSKYDQL